MILNYISNYIILHSFISFCKGINKMFNLNLIKHKNNLIKLLFIIYIKFYSKKNK